METREEAICWLQEHGLFARARDWAMGASVCVWARQETDSKSGITVFHDVLYLYPESSGWSLCDLRNPRGADKSCGSLANAVQEVARLLGRAANACGPELM